jgi:cell pole-organizing protein PopZ
MTEAKNQQAEPSMEEILASIRRIISEDTDAGKAAAPAAPAAAPSPAAPPPAAAAAPPPSPPPPQPAPAPAADVLELTEMVGDDGKVTEIAEERPASPPPAAPATDEDDQLVSNRAASAAAGALAGLAAASRKPEGTDMRGLMGVGNGAMTLEEIVRSEMRPILKAWLDENLPPLVERLVQKEIKRITRQVDET